MIDINKLKSAKVFIDSLANGRNPFGGAELPSEDVVNDVRSVRWLFYISGVLGEVIQNGGITAPSNTKGRGEKLDYYLTDEMKANFRFSDTPISQTEIIKRIIEIGPTENVKKFPRANVMSWLISIGLIDTFQSKNGKTLKRPSQLGEEMGIFQEPRFINGHFYYAILYNKEAQKFIVDNVDAILAFDAKAFDAKNREATETTDRSEGDDSIAEKNEHGEDLPDGTPDDSGIEPSSDEDESTAAQDTDTTEATASTAAGTTSATTDTENAGNGSRTSAKTEKTCLDCKFSRSGECFPQKKICAEFELAYTVDEDERNAWPDYGDATALKRGERR